MDNQIVSNALVENQIVSNVQKVQTCDIAAISYRH